MSRAGRGKEREHGPFLTQIMVAIQVCQNKLIYHFGEHKLEFSFVKHDMQKLKEKAQASDHRIASLEDTERPLDTAVQGAKKTLSEGVLWGHSVFLCVFFSLPLLFLPLFLFCETPCLGFCSIDLLSWQYRGLTVLL